MRRHTKLNIALLVATLVVFGGAALVALGGGGSDGDNDKSVKAHAVVTGPGGIEGIVRFEQPPCPGCPSPADPMNSDEFRNFPEPTVKVTAEIRGLTPGAHGFHIHEHGTCDPPTYVTSGGHFDPGPNSNSNPDANHPFHMGDLPNLIAEEKGVGRLKHTTSRVTLSPGPLSVFDADGSSVIVHLNPDRGIPGPPGSGVSGGPRIACGVIELDED